MIATYYEIEQTQQPSCLPHGMSLQLGRNQKKRHPTLALYSQRARKYQMAWIQVNNCSYTLKHLNITLTCVGYRTLLYTCCRDGKPRENKTQRKTEKKRLSLKKTRKFADSYCLARMYVKHHLSTGNVEVEYTYTHTQITHQV